MQELDHKPGRRVLVTGASGFTGSHLCRYLLGQGYQVDGLVRAQSKDELITDLDITTVVGDLRDKKSLLRACQNTNTVYHIAAAFREVRLSDQDYFDINVQGTRNLIEAAVKCGVQRFVHCSTIGVHGDTGRSPASEESAYSPPDYYCETKLEGELLARELFEKYSLQGSVFRPLGIYGPGDTRFLKMFKSIRNGRFIMIGSGETVYHLTFIEDLCQGIALCGQHPDAVGEVFIIGGESHNTLNEIAETICDAVGGRLWQAHIPLSPVMLAARCCETICRPFGIEPPLYPRRVEFFSKNRAATIQKAKDLLDYKPRHSLQEGIAETAKWYRNKGWI